MSRFVRKNGFQIVMLGAIVVLAAWFAWSWRLRNRPIAHTPTAPIYDGIIYHHHEVKEPRPIHFHTLAIDMTRPGIRFFVTPPDNDHAENHLNARKTTTFLAEHNLQLAINGSFFYPFFNRTPLYTYPNEGDAVTVVGFNRSGQTTYGITDNATFQPVCFLPDRVLITEQSCPPETEHALSGSRILMLNGKYKTPADEPNRIPEPRTILAHDDSGQKVWLIVADGRQRNYSEGTGLFEIAEFAARAGATNSIALDGGGSSTMATDHYGEPRLLNSPIHTGIPLRERPVGNHLGIYASPVGEDFEWDGIKPVWEP